MADETVASTTTGTDETVTQTGVVEAPEVIVNNPKTSEPVTLTTEEDQIAANKQAHVEKAMDSAAVSSIPASHAPFETFPTAAGTLPKHHENTLVPEPSEKDKAALEATTAANDADTSTPASNEVENPLASKFRAANSGGGADPELPSSKSAPGGVRVKGSPDNTITDEMLGLAPWTTGRFKGQIKKVVQQEVPANRKPQQ